MTVLGRPDRRYIPEMGFDLRGHTVLSYGEFIELTKCMVPDADMPAEMVAWFAGERLSPRTLQTGLERCAPLVINDRGHELLSFAARRLGDAIGRGEWDFGPWPPALPGEL